MTMIKYPPPIEQGLQRIASLLQGEYALSKRSLAILLLTEDDEIHSLVAEIDTKHFDPILQIVHDLRGRFTDPIAYVLSIHQHTAAMSLLKGIIEHPAERPTQWRDRLSQAMLNPISGLPILALALLGMYWFVGVLGAQTMVDWLEGVLFGEWINPWVTRLFQQLVPWQPVRLLFVGEYGIFTLGVRYAVALILPIVGTFFLAFAVIEDSGYLPRLALLIDRVFKKIGLNGRAVIPMVLGFGCDTMATIVTRTLETRRERLISTMLLALAIPCSAQLGVIFAILAGEPTALAVWGMTVLGVFMLVGFLSAKILPGERPTFHIELPPLRLPRLGNILIKTYSRMEWYLKEVIPLFLLASVLIWIGQLTGLFDLIIRGLQPAVRFLGLPDETAVAFLFGFFRRDYGAAGLFDVQGALSVPQLTVAAVTMTLFVPCIAQFGVMVKERGWKVALAVVAFIFPFAFLIGWGLRGMLGLIGWQS